MGKKIVFSLLFCSFLLYPRLTYAVSNYVLPYPSAMPGSLWYKLTIVLEHIEQYWYFGNFSHVVYNLKKADKYLVEAKTLFEYKQYLLADQALQKSSRYFAKIYPSLRAARIEGKDITEKKALYLAAVEKHIEVLRSLLTSVPETYAWVPEKQSGMQLPLHFHINEAIKIRTSNQ